MVPPSARRLGKRPSTAAVAVVAALALLLWWLLPGGGSAPSGSLVFTTGVPGGVYERYGELLRQQLGRDLPEVEVSLLPSEGSVQNIDRLVSGEASFTIAAADAVAAHLEEDRPGADRLRACARLYDDYIQLVVPADSPVREAADLKGLRVGLGQERSGVNLIAGRLLRAAGLDPKRDVRPVLEGIDRMPELLVREELDAFFWSGGLPTGAIAELADTADVRLVPLGDLVPALHSRAPETRSSYRAALMPADAYPKIRNSRAVETIAVANLLVTVEGTDDALTEGVTRSVINSRDRIGREVHAAQKVDLRTAIYTHPLPLHSGAERYYRSVKS
ncbi:TAXI family TRAP transporter solute-binding subunit [Streptomyces sp. TRM43335]|uniref:TAXI family TRAP transporter solute-binding subunit n=1 Tax=Streptomyces taklimakanensis TaxID=2569853 RepID=A0A6G2BHE8_9ACTN|nr:TAXI family TRAP transporter solute-binding subunit [Streptomyces taklimakanensis]MTE21322.1 TAXI family TRAP transporter solute-binding subunit [Streptomyces taklimakanensis]